MPKNAGGGNLVAPFIEPVQSELKGHRRETRDQAVNHRANHRPGFVVDAMKLSGNACHDSYFEMVALRRCRLKIISLRP